VDVERRVQGSDGSVDVERAAAAPVQRQVLQHVEPPRLGQRLVDHPVPEEQRAGKGRPAGLDPEAANPVDVRVA